MVDYINPAASRPDPLGPASRRDYEKRPERMFRLKQDVLVPADTVFTRAPLERGGYDRVEGVVGLGTHVTAYLNLPLRVAEVDATDWFEEILDRDVPENNESESEREKTDNP